MTLDAESNFPPRAWQRWTPREDEILRKLCGKKLLCQVAKRLGRTPGAVKHRTFVCNIAVRYSKISMRPSLSTWRAAVSAASDKSGVAFETIAGRSHKRPAVRARWAAFRILRDQGYSLPSIGKAGEWTLDHATVFHGLQRLAELRP